MTTTLFSLRSKLSSYWLKGKDFSLDNGMNVSVKDGKSLTGRIGVDIGKNFAIADKNPAQVYFARRHIA